MLTLFNYRQAFCNDIILRKKSWETFTKEIWYSSYAKFNNKRNLCNIAIEFWITYLKILIIYIIISPTNSAKFEFIFEDEYGLDLVSILNWTDVRFSTKFLLFINTYVKNI